MNNLFPPSLELILAVSLEKLFEDMSILLLSAVQSKTKEIYN